MTATADLPYQEITDPNGRVYRVGESPQQLMGRSRGWMIWLPWLAMMGVSVFEYGYGSAEDTLEKVHGWSFGEAWWLVAIWTVFQSGVAFPAGRLREKGIVSAKVAMLTGAVMVFSAFFVLGASGNIVLNFLFYSVVGGIGSGLVYATCINMVAKWYPEKRGGKTGFVNGGFAYGAVPFIYVFRYFFNEHNYALILGLIGAYMLIIVGICGFLFKDPPKNWWPAEVDPLNWGKEPKSERSLRMNPPAVKQYGPIEAIKTGQLPLLWLCLTIIAGVSLFGIGYQVPFAKAMGFGPLVAASSAGVLSIVNGVGRGVVGWLSDYVGRKQALIIVLVIEGIAQFGVMWSGTAHNQVLFIAFAFLSGFGGGAFYNMFAALTPDYFGENNNATNYGLVYSAKLVSGVIGFGVGSSVIKAFGYNGAYMIAGGIAFLSAVIAMFFRQPGRPRNTTGGVLSAPGTTSAGPVAG